MHIQIIIMLIITSLISGLGGFIIGKNQNAQTIMTRHDRFVPMHVHEPREVEPNLPTPAISLSVEKDLKAGYNLQINTDHFVFRPEAASTGYRPGEGHAHLYINDEKIGRLYGPWYHISSLPTGSNKIRVSLSGNDHTELTYKGNPISAEILIEVN